MKLAGSSEERSRAWKGIRFLEALLGAVAVIAAAVAGSVFLVCRAMPEAAGFFAWGDGYYRIYTARDYKRFWELAKEKPQIKGRLMSDIYLNNVANYEKWETAPPSGEVVKIDNFYGVFDGNGHTVYGLYSVYGYGLVKENGGEIYDLSIRKSLIKGGAEVGGFCQSNISTISGCVFGGTLAANKGVIIRDEKRAGGICAVNSGKIEKCGYEGRMAMNPGWNQEGTRGGISGCNVWCGEIIGCYNLSYRDTSPGEGSYYAITGGTAQDCYCLRNSCWKIPKEGVRELEREQVVYLSALLKGDLFQLYWREGHLPECYGQLEEMGRALKAAGGQPKGQAEGLQVKLPWELAGALADGEPGPLGAGTPWGGQTAFSVGYSSPVRGQMQEGLAVRNFLLDERAEGFIKLLMALNLDKGALLPVEGGAGSRGDLSSAVWFTAGEERIKLGRYPQEFLGSGAGINIDYEALWKACGNILGKGAESFTHATWHINYGSWETEPAFLVLYTTDEGALGLFYVADGQIYQAEAGNRGERDGIRKIRELVKGLEEPGVEEEVIAEASGNALWTALFCSLWQDGMPGDGLSWRDINMRKEIYRECSCSGMEIPAVEDIVGLEALEVKGAVGTFEDLKKLPKLAALSVEGGESNIDLTQDMVPALRELYLKNAAGVSMDFVKELPQLTILGVVNCELEDISFLEGLPELTEITFYSNQIKDISPLTNCRKLQVLSLAYNVVEDISPLAALANLKEVGLQGNRLTDIKPLENLKDMERLNLSVNGITDLSPLKGMEGLKALGAADNQIKDITPLEGMEEMYNLELAYNQIVDISPLKGMAKMEYLGLQSNEIMDFQPIMGMEKLYSLSVAGNPIQDIGEKLFVPWLFMGHTYPLGEGELNKAQGCLDLYYPGQGIIAHDFAWGDLNGDGIEDLAVAGLVGWEEDNQWSGDRFVYPFISRGDGTFYALEALEALGPGSGGVYGDPYCGMLITGQRLAVQVYGGSNWRWGSLKIYEYQEGQMEEKWQLDIDHFVYNSGMDMDVYDREGNRSWQYVAVGEQEEHKELLLVHEDTGDRNSLKEELDRRLGNFAADKALELPEIAGAAPDLDGWYDYRINDYQAAKDPSWVLAQAAGEFLGQAEPLPIPEYTSTEIKESYEKLIGVELPGEFYIGLLLGEPVLLQYNSCTGQPDGSYVHEIFVKKPEGDFWAWDKTVYYYEDTEAFELRGTVPFE